jgi:two-component system, response regulator
MHASSTTLGAEPVAIVVAEDNKYDRMILAEAFREIDLNVTLSFVSHGEELLDYLHGRNHHAEAQVAPRPSLILMDLNMPRMDGNEALKRIRADATLRKLPVVVLSMSDSSAQIAEAYDNGANAFMTKPGHFDDLVRMLRSFGHFWLREAKLPGPN